MTPAVKNDYLSAPALAPARSTADQVYDLLRERVLTGEIAPKERLIETAIARALSISRTPVREAFRRLEQDGLVERLPQGGIRALALTVQAVEEAFGVRAVLEAYAGELACDLISNEQLDQLHNLTGRAAEYMEDVRSGDAVAQTELAKLNKKFHDIIVAAAGNRVLLNQIAGLDDLIFRARLLALKVDAVSAWRDHQQIIKQLRAGRKAALTELLQQHIHRSAEAAVKAIKESDELNTQEGETV